MLEAIPASRLPYEWETIGPALSRATAQDPKRSGWDVMGLMFDPSVKFWRVSGGLIVTQQVGTALWVLYTAGNSGGLRNMRELLALIETKAREMRCREIRFEGRDWRRVARGYHAHQTADGRWHYRKAVL